MRKGILVLLYLFVFQYIAAQEGAPRLTHYVESREVENQNWAICQDFNNVMLFANRKGILSFDGHSWLPVRIPIIPYSIQANPDNNKIYIGGENSFGLLEKDVRGSYIYRSLDVNRSDLGIVTKIIFKDSLAWLYGEQSVTRFNLVTGKVELCIKSTEPNPFTWNVCYVKK